MLPVIERPAERVAAPERCVLLAVVSVGRRLVAVGERGIITRSDDGGAHWTQGSSPTSVTLTALAFADERTGWAVGHSGVILRTLDGGMTWQRQFDGVRAARLAQRQAAQAHGPFAAGFRHLSQQLVEDGPDAPFLTLLVRDRRHVVAAGANGLLFATDDGGEHWRARMAGIDNPRGLHYYALAASRTALYVAGEAGLLARSTDDGRSFVRLAAPYTGSFFSAGILAGGGLLLAGFHGTILLSRDEGRHFRSIALPFAATLTSQRVLANGDVVLTSQAGALFAADSVGRVRLYSAARIPLAADVVRAPDGRLIVVGFGGVTRVARGEGP